MRNQQLRQFNFMDAICHIRWLRGRLRDLGTLVGGGDDARFAIRQAHRKDFSFTDDGNPVLKIMTTRLSSVFLS
jgi:hypothetical protein